MKKTLALTMVLWSALAQAALPPKAAVATAHPLATKAALDVMDKGGNAFDAAIAATAVLAVAEPYGSGIGGGGFYLLHRQEDGFETMIDARETAPLKATKDMFLNKEGEVDRQLAINGPLAAGIPGIPAALDYLARTYGRLSLKDSLAAGIEYAENGVEVDAKIQRMLNFRLRAIQNSPAAAAVFLVDGQVPDVGAKLVQKDLAKTLRIIAEEGHDGFYKGEYAEQLADGVRAAGGIWSKQDLDEYLVKERVPVRGDYKGMRVTSAALPSSGGVALVQMLNTLANYDLDSQHNHQQIHLLVESMRRAYRDRAHWMGDPDFVDVPVNQLTHPLYAAGLAASIREDRATKSSDLPGVTVPQGGEDTTHFSILDKEGNRVAATLSINYPFGSGFMVEGTGVLLNDEMDDFVAKPGEPNVYGLVGGEANSIAAGKRMLSSMTPTFLEYDNKVAIVGTPGGSRIITMVLQAALAFKQGLPVKEIVALPRLHHQFLPDVIQYESNALGKDLQYELLWLGHELKEMTRQYGNMQMVVWDMKRGKVEAASDPRGIGRADIGSYSQ